jgi:hypothetical protein
MLPYSTTQTIIYSHYNYILKQKKMKKLFTLLTLLLGIGSGAWADEAVLYYAGTSGNSIIVNGFTITITGNDSKSWTNGNGDISYGGTTYKTLKNSNGAQNTITCPDGKVATKIVFYATSNADAAGKLSEFDGTTCSDEVSSLKDYSNPTIIEKTIASKDAFTFTFSTKQVCFIAVVTYEDAVSDEPSLKVLGEKSMTLALTPSATTKSGTFTLKGANLTNGTYNLTTPSVTGLTVSPTSFTVSEGAVEQVFTVSYSSTTDVAQNTVIISAAVGELSDQVEVTYSAHITPYELTAVSAATTWDFSKITVNTSSERYGDNGIKLTAETSPAYTDEIVYENYNGSDFTIASGFDGTTMAFTGQYPIRNNNMCQAGTLHFKTTVPGVITVKFSDTGSSASATATPRYLIVNGCQTQYWTSRPTSGSSKSNDTKTSGDIYVPAGDVTITGSQAICMYIVTFTPTSEIPTTTVTVSDKGYRTFASKYPLDFSTPVSGLKVYKATLTENIVSFSEVTTAVPAGEGLLLKGEGEFTLNIATVRPEAIDNALIGVTVEKTVDAGIFVLMDGDSGVGFYKTTDAFTVGANTAYLPALPAPASGEARAFIALDIDETTTGINAALVNNENGEVYNLQGQRVVKAQKGLYIMNGKKVLVK